MMNNENEGFMKKIIYILIIVIIIIAIILSKYSSYKKKYSQIQEYNLQYEKYLDKEIYGTDIATIINKAVDNNEKNYIEKDENGKYIQNDVNSVNIEIKIIDLEEEKIYSMETLYNGGMAQFVQYYSTILFKSAEVKYNSAGKICYILFEQITK